jgi:HK97 family phage portal protein
MRNPLKRREKALTGTAEVVAALQTGWNPIPLLGGGSRQRIMDAYTTAKSANYAWIYANVPAVRTVIDVLVRNVGQLDLRLYEEINEAERQARPDHPAALSLRYPNETTTSDSFIRSLLKDFLLFDDSYALLTPAGNQLNLNWIPTQYMEIRGSSMFNADIYRFWRPEGFGYVDFTPDQILHWHGENPLDARTGLSRLDTLRDVIAEDAALQAATVELANSGLQEPAWVFRPGDAPEWSNDARKGFEEDLNNRLRRRNSMPVVLEEGMEMRSFGVSPRDAQMFEVRKWAVSQIAGAYGVPLGMVGLADDVKSAQSQFYGDTLPPLCEEMTKMLNLRILVRAYGWTDGCFEFNLDEKLMGDDRLKALTSATGRPVMLTNEARAKINLPPVDGGDELVTPMNVIVGDNPKPSPQIMPPQDPNGPEQDGSYREQPKALVKAQEKLPQLHPARGDELKRQHRNIDLAKAAVERHLTRVERQLKKIATKASTKATDGDWERWDREFTDDLERLLAPIVEVEGTKYAFKLAGEFDMDLVANYLRAMADGMAKGINDNLRERIDSSGLDAALSRHSAHVESAGTSIGVTATTWAREEAARQSPGFQGRVKTWIADTARHAEFDGDTVPVDADWPAGFAPGGAPNCACTLSIS